MRYAYHFEFCERPEMPEWLRGDLFLSLGFIQDLFGLRRILDETVPSLVLNCGAKRVIELGCGSGQGLARVAHALPHLPMLATDVYPHPQLWAEALKGQKAVTWSERSVGFDDFDQVLSDDLLQGSVLLLMAAFHHAPPARARKFLERAARCGSSIIIVEPLERTALGVLLGASAALPALVYPIRALVLGHQHGLPARVIAWLRLAVFHWVIPLIPLILFHDGVVSAFRQRTTPDWLELTQGLPFTLEARQGLGPFRNFSAVLLSNRSGQA